VSFFSHLLATFFSFNTFFPQYSNSTFVIPQIVIIVTILDSCLETVFHNDAVNALH
jgi:hypothetical protein